MKILIPTINPLAFLVLSFSITIMSCNRMIDKEHELPSISIDIDKFHGGSFSFSNMETGQVDIPLNGKLENGITKISIPDSLLGAFGSITFKDTSESAMIGSFLLLDNAKIKLSMNENVLVFSGSELQDSIGLIVKKISQYEQEIKLLSIDTTQIEAVNSMKKKMFRETLAFSKYLTTQGYTNVSSYLIYGMHRMNLLPPHIVKKIQKDCDESEEYFWKNQLCNLIVNDEINNIRIADWNFQASANQQKIIANAYTLVDVWASWCSPCIQGIPHLKTIYQKYKPKGLQIFSLSIDTDFAKWKNKSAELKLPWPSSLDNATIKRRLSHQLNITAIPHYFLLDQDGHILARDIAAEELDQTLNRFLN